MAKKTISYDNQQNNFSTRLLKILGSKDYLNAFKWYVENELHNAETKEDKDRYGSKLAELNRREQLTYDDIAFMAGKDKSAVTRWLNSKEPAIPDVTVATRIAKALGITTDYLLGVAGTPNIKIEETYKVFEKYGIDPQAFQNLNNFYNESYSAGVDEQHIIDFKKTVMGLNLLLSQHTGSTRMDILNRVGYFLTQSRFDAYYYFDSDDVDDLFDGLFKSIDSQNGFNQDFVKNRVTDFLSNAPRFSISDSVLVSLDTIRDKLKEYKMHLDPDFFNENIPDSARFYTPKQVDITAE